MKVNGVRLALILKEQRLEGVSRVKREIKYWTLFLSYGLVWTLMLLTVLKSMGR